MPQATLKALMTLEIDAPKTNVDIVTAILLNVGDTYLDSMEIAFQLDLRIE